MSKEYTFDYSSIPLGFYDKIAKERKGMRSFWHYLKFQRIIDYIEMIPNASKIIDYGCFCGTFLGMLDNKKFKKQIGLDILKDQIDYANSIYKTEFRDFMLIEDYKSLENVEKTNVISIVEVIEHLEISQIEEILLFASDNLEKGGKLIFTTPNYLSTWPILEIILNKVSEVNYEEQHITKFTYFNIDQKLRKINPKFSEEFETEFVTTSHFLTPFIAQLSFSLAAKLSKFAPHNKWSFPFGNIIMICFNKK
jgi:2-polyprenyl-3-methyl-5-hydroxy-6-metoxy-1,4-benzoquinol methylase